MMKAAGTLKELRQLGIYGGDVEKGFCYLENLTGPASGVEPGAPAVRVEIDGDRVFALHRRYETEEEARVQLEAHRTYIDIQYIVEGGELIGVAGRDAAPRGLGYDEKKDVEFFEGIWRETIHLKAGYGAVFLPGELHAPGIMTGNPSPVYKVVVKVRAK